MKIVDRWVYPWRRPLLIGQSAAVNLYCPLPPLLRHSRPKPIQKERATLCMDRMMPNPSLERQLFDRCCWCLNITLAIRRPSHLSTQLKYLLLCLFGRTQFTSRVNSRRSQLCVTEIETVASHSFPLSPPPPTITSTSTRSSYLLSIPKPNRYLPRRSPAVDGEPERERSPETRAPAFVCFFVLWSFSLLARREVDDDGNSRPQCQGCGQGDASKTRHGRSVVSLR